MSGRATTLTLLESLQAIDVPRCVAWLTAEQCDVWFKEQEYESAFARGAGYRRYRLENIAVMVFASVSSTEIDAALSPLGAP